MQFNIEKEYAESLDKADKLAHFRHQFYIPKQKNNEDFVYLCGNSLGLQPKITQKYVENVLVDWKTLGVEGHVHGKYPWLSYHEILTNQLASLVGAKPIEVVAMNSLTVNLHLLMVSFYTPTVHRNKIIIEESAFPSDIYAVKSQLKFHGYSPETHLILLKPKEGETTIQTQDILELLENEGETVSLVLLGGVNYYTGQVFDMSEIAKKARAKGCYFGVDLAHAIGNISLSLHKWEVDFACWCSYKYLNSGPGSTAGIFVHEKYANSTLPRFEGWWGQNKASRFLMQENFDGISGAEGWQLSNPAILPMAALKASLDIFEHASLTKLIEKSKVMTEYLFYLLEFNEFIEVITPRNSGCQLSLRIRQRKDVKNIFLQLEQNGVIADWREPDVIRIAPVPLYNTYLDCWQFVQIINKLTNY